MSLFDRLKAKIPRSQSSASFKAAEGPSRKDSKNATTASASWNPNPFLDPSSATPNEAPPAYTAGSNPSKSTGLSVGRLSLASVTSPEDKYAFLSTFDTVFVIDDSGSMAGRSWREVRDVLSAIAPICTSHDSDGIDVYFLNHESGAAGSAYQAPDGYTNIRDPAQVQSLFESIRPSGATLTGTCLQKILNPYLASIARRPGSMDTVKPVNIIVITDGCPNDEPEGIIVQHARKLDQLEAPPHQVGIQFFQVGTEFGATEALEELDNGLARNKIRDMVDTVTWSSTASDGSKSLSADGILKVVLGAVVRRLDRKTASRPASRN